jgi:hypothetical protein
MAGGIPQVDDAIVAIQNALLASGGFTGGPVNALGVKNSTCTLAYGYNSVTTGSGNLTATLPAAIAGGRVIVIVTQGGTARTWTATGSLNPGGTGLALTASAAAVDILEYRSDGISWYGFVAVKNFS